MRPASALDNRHYVRVTQKPLRDWRLPPWLWMHLVGVLVVAALSACSDPSSGEAVEFDPKPPPPDAPADVYEDTGALLQVSYLGEDEPPESDPVSKFVVRLQNPLTTTFEWPEPCPVYSMESQESATTYEQERFVLPCEGLDPLEPCESQDFHMETKAYKFSPGIRWQWRFDDPRVRGTALVGKIEFALRGDDTLAECGGN